MNRTLPLFVLTALLIATAAPVVAESPTTQPTTQPAAQSAAQPRASWEFTVLQRRDDRLIAVLPNRLIVIAQELPTSPVVSAQVFVKTGSLYEQEHVGAGLSHFLEHLLAGGTTSTRTEDENNRILGEIGAQVNASTSLDTVKYYVNTTADRSDEAIDLLTDWMRNNQITQAEFDRERAVIQNEFSMGEGDPGRIFWKLTQQGRYANLPNHPAAHPTIGYLDEFLSITREEILDFYKRMYVPNNMVFVVVGDIDKEEAVARVAELWKDAKPGELPAITIPVEGEQGGVREVTGYADVQRPRVRLAWPGTKLAGPDDYEMDLLASVLGEGESSRLTREIRDRQQVVSSIDAFNLSFPWGEGFFGIDAEVAAFAFEHQGEGGIAIELERMEVVKKAALKEVQRLRDEPVSDAELKRAKRKVLARVLTAGQTAPALADRLGSDTISQGDPDYLTRYAKAVQDITPEQLQQAATRRLDPQRLIVVSLLPTPEGQEPQTLKRPEVKGAADGEGVKLDLDNRTQVEALKANLAKAEDVQPISRGELQSFTLDNGLRVLVRRTTTVPAVSMQLYWLGGLLAEDEGERGIANAAAAMMRRGTESKSAEEIAAAVEDLGASLGTSSGNNTTYATASSLSEDWQKVMGLLADVTLHPSFSQEEWGRLQPRLLAAIDRQNDSWSGELRRDFLEAFYGEHPWADTPLGKREVVEKLTPADLATWHREHLGADNAVLAVVGDVDPEAVKAKAEELFGQLPSKAKAAFEPVKPEAPEPRVVQVVTRKPVAAVQIGYGPGLTRSDADYAAMQVLSTVMSDFPAGWLEQELRGKHTGLVYAAWGYPQVGLVPGHFAVGFNTSPDAAPEAIARAVRVVERAKSESINADDLARAKAKVLTSELFSRQSNAGLAAEAALDSLYGVDDPTGEKFVEQVRAVDAAKLQQVARKYLQNPVALILTSRRIEDAVLERAMRGELPEGVADEGEAPATQPRTELEPLAD